MDTKTESSTPFDSITLGELLRSHNGEISLAAETILEELNEELDQRISDMKAGDRESGNPEEPEDQYREYAIKEVLENLT